jgi:hypothetical protein
MTIRSTVRLLMAVLVVFSWASLGATPARAASSGLVISEIFANPAGNDSPFEYVELVATQAIDFSTTPYSVVFTNNGSASAQGWVAGGALTYGFSITTGSVARGDVVYVGGSSMAPTGPKLRAIDTSASPGDRLGDPAAGVLGNGGDSADGIAVFAAGIGSLTATSVPVDALFFGTAVGTSAPAEGGYELPVNDRYSGGKLRAGSFLGPDPGSGQVLVASGVYDVVGGSFSTPRTWTLDTPTDRSSTIVLSGNAPLATACPAVVFATAGSQQTAQVQASDTDGVVGAPQLSGAAPGGITLENATAASGIGQTANAVLRVAATAAPGDYEVGVSFSNADAPPQTAQCTVRVRVLRALPATGTQPGTGQQAERCFTETGFCISGAIRTYWERNGGLATFGFPISVQRNETVEGTWTGPVQWFERDRLEDHTNEGKGVLAGRLGARALELQGVDWQTLPRDAAAAPGCSLFPETQLSVCEPFLSYWRRNGGLARFGYPITQVRKETLEGKEYSVQYFERRRMELHPENAGTPYEVLLGLLGRDVYTVDGQRGAAPTVPGDVSAEVQQSALDAAYAALRAQGERAKLAVGLVDVTGDKALVLARPYGKDPLVVALTRSAGTWKVAQATEALSADRGAVVDLALVQFQDPSGQGVNIYITQPRISGDYARLSASPGATEDLEGGTMFFKREGGVWRFLSAGTAFSEEDLRELGVPQDLWSQGADVRGPAS